MKGQVCLQVSESGGSTILTQHNPLFGSSQVSSPRKALPLQPALRTPSEEEPASATSSITGLTGRRRISTGQRMTRLEHASTIAILPMSKWARFKQISFLFGGSLRLVKVSGLALLRPLLDFLLE